MGREGNGMEGNEWRREGKQREGKGRYRGADEQIQVDLEERQDSE